VTPIIRRSHQVSCFSYERCHDSPQASCMDPWKVPPWLDIS
jgi:hypothetical protein